jgi:metallo-beta-lactamase class B
MKAMELHKSTNCVRYICASAFAVFFLVVITSAQAQEGEPRRPDRQVPGKPFHLIGNVYYVGQTDNSIPGSDDASFLIKTRDGLILLDTGEEAAFPQITSHIQQLGFRTSDIKYLIHSHSHSDHVAGDADLKKLVPAVKILATAQDAEVIESGGKKDFDTTRAQFKPVKIDRIIKDGETLTLGEVTLTAHLTPGHTRGCTTWTTTVEDAGRKLNAIFVCSARISEGVALVNNERYPEIAADFRKTFATLKDMPVDVFFASHGFFFDLVGKAKLAAGSPKANPFIDPQGYKNFITQNEKSFLAAYAKQGGK